MHCQPKLGNSLEYHKVTPHLNLLCSCNQATLVRILAIRQIKSGAPYTNLADTGRETVTNSLTTLKMAPLHSLPPALTKTNPTKIGLSQLHLSKPNCRALTSRKPSSLRTSLEQRVYAHPPLLHPLLTIGIPIQVQPST